MLGEGRRQPGPRQAQAQVRWNRLCSLTASLKLKAPHTQSICVTPHGLQHQPELSSHTTQKPQNTHQKPTAGPWLGLGNKKQHGSPASGEPLFQPEEALLTPKNQIFRICFCSQTHPNCFWPQGDSRARHPPGRKLHMHRWLCGFLFL